MSDFGDRLLAGIRAGILRRDYARCLKRLRRAAAGRKLRVVFYVSELAKWKGESLFRALEGSERFEPVIAVMNLTRQAGDPPDAQRRSLDEKLRFFRDCGRAVIGLLAQPTDALAGALVGALLAALVLVAWARSGIYLEYSFLAQTVAAVIG